MSSFTSKTVRDLYEAYDAVYINEEEIFLNQLLGEVAETINGLVDEGWDFSEYSWEEIYESFIDNVLVAEIDEINSFFVSLNEEVLSEEEIDNFMQENLLMRGLARLLPGAKGVQQATTTATRATRPSIIQAAPVKPGVPAAPKPSLQTALGPGVRPVKPSKPLPPPGSGPGSFERFGNWLSSLTAKGRAKPPASTPPSTPPPSTPPRTPSGQQGWPSVGVRKKAAEVAKGISDTYSKVKTALTPGPKTKAALKYGVLPAATIGLTAAPFVSTANLLSGRPSGLQQLSGVAQGATGHIMQGTAGVLGKLGSPDAPGMYELGKTLRQAGADTQAKVEAKRKSQQGTGRTGTTGQVDPTTGKPVYNSYEMKGEESLQEVLAYDKKNDRWYNIDPSGKKTEVTPTQTAIDRYNRLKSQAPAPAAQPPRRQPAPASQPPRRQPAPAAAKPEDKKPGESTVEYHRRLRGLLPPASPRQAPPSAPALPAAGAPTSGRQTAPAPEPGRSTAPAPQASPVAAYMKAAAAARKSGDPAEMAKVRDMGMEIWKTTYKDTLAKKVNPDGTQKGTGQSIMAKQAAELRALRPAPQAPVNQSSVQPVAPQPVARPVKTDTAAQRVQSAQKPIPSSVKPIDTSKLSKPTGRTQSMVAASYEYEPYDLVLEYLLSEGHADTVEEAHYVMMQMSAEHIQDIVEDVYMAPVKPETKPKPTKPEGEGRSILGPGRSGDFGKGYERRDKPTVPSKTPPTNPGRAEGGTGLPPGQVPPNVKKYASGG